MKIKKDKYKAQKLWISKPENKKKANLACKLWRLKPENKKRQYELDKQWRINNPIQSKKINLKATKKWKKSHPEHHKLLKKKNETKRKRKLGFNLIYPNILDEKFVYHHINNNDVITIPKDIHELYSGYITNIHRDLCLNITKQIYGVK